jgi:hypothetical protein
VANRRLLAQDSRHAVSSVAPRLSRYVPDGQSLQASLPSPGAYLPRSHCRQSLEESLPGTSMYLPAMQPMQSDSASLPWTSTYLPSPQGIQSEPLPGTSTYLPAAQSTQSVAASLPDESRYLPITQLMQSDAAVCPLSSRYFPGMQAMQSSSEGLPVMPLNFPRGHIMQSLSVKLAGLVEYLLRQHRTVRFKHLPQKTKTLHTVMSTTRDLPYESCTIHRLVYICEKLRRYILSTWTAEAVRSIIVAGEFRILAWFAQLAVARRCAPNDRRISSAVAIVAV